MAEESSRKNPRDNQAHDPRAHGGKSGSPAPGSEHGNDSRDADGGDAQRHRLEVAKRPSGENSNGDNPTPPETPRPQSGKGDQAPQRRADMERALKQEHRQDM